MYDPANDLSQIMTMLQQFQFENVALRDSLRELQVGVSLYSQPTEPSLPPQPRPEPNPPPTSSLDSSHFLEPKVSLPEKFDGTRSHFRGFINQIRLIIRLQPQRYAHGLRNISIIWWSFTSMIFSFVFQTWRSTLAKSD